MTKKNFVSLVIGVIGGVLFALGMCMCMLPEWNAFRPGCVLGVLGAVVLLVMVLVRRRMEGKPMVVVPSGKAVAAVLVGLVGALGLGIGMCMTMIWEMMIPGILVGLAGIVVLLALIPLCKGIKPDDEPYAKN